jgi:hypothetical protein
MNSSISKYNFYIKPLHRTLGIIKTSNYYRTEKGRLFKIRVQIRALNVENLSAHRGRTLPAHK